MGLGIGVLLMGVTAMAQNVEIAVQILDGRNGKPVPKHQLVVFTGLSSDSAKRHEANTSITTDKDGLAMLKVSVAETQWIQVWANGLVLCQANPDDYSLNVDAIMKAGVSTPNTCSSTVREAAAGRLVVFMRPTHFREKNKE